MDWLDSFNQEVQGAQQQEGPPIAPAQLQSEILPEPEELPSAKAGPETDWFDTFDTQVQEAQKVLEVPQDVKTGKTFESWFDEKYSGAKEFLEATGESVVQLGYGAVSFLPSYGLGFATMLNEKLKNVLRQDRIRETVRRGGFPEDKFPTDLARKPMAQRLEEAKIKSPKQIRALADKSSEFFASVIEEPVTPGGKKVIGKAGELMDWLFHYPKLADKKLAEAGYPNLGYLAGFAGEMLLLKGLHGAAKKGKKVSKNVISRYIKTVEDVKKIETPAQLKETQRQVDKILDELGISEEQRIVATDKTFRAQKDVGSWIEERARIRETAKEVPSAKEIREEVRAPSKEERPEQREAERIRLRDVKEDRVEAPKEREVTELRTKMEVSDNLLGYEYKQLKGELLAIYEKYPQVKYRDAGISNLLEKDIKNIKEVPLEVLKKVDKINDRIDDLVDIDFERGVSKHRAFFIKDQIDTIELAEYLSEGKKQKLRESRIRLVEEPKPETLKKVSVEEPSVRKLNVEEQFGKRVAGEISDGIKVAEDMGVFETIRSGVEGKKKVGEIMKTVKESRYYEEDLKDFGYVEKDLRSAIRAVKIREFGDVKIGEALKEKLAKEVAKKPKKIKEPSGPPRVDVERGRPPGVEADLKKYERPVDVKGELLEYEIRREAEMAPMRTAEGKLVGSKVLAMRMAKSRGLVGEVVRTPDKKGWYVKKTKEMKKVEADATKRFWDEMLKEEGMEVLEPETGMVRGTVEVLKSERGSVVLQSETIKKLRSSVKRKRVSEADLIAEMQRRKVPNSQILKAFPNAFKKEKVIGTSEFLKKGQDPREFMPRKVLKRGKDGKPTRYAPAITRGDAHMVSTFTADMPKAPIGEKIRVLATSEGIFTRLGKDIKETFYRPMTKAAKAESDFSTALVKEGNILKKQFSIGTRQKHAERIEKYAISKQKDGLARLKAQGIKENQIPKELSTKEQLVYDTQQKVYKGLYKAINKAREAAGQQKFPPVENYSPWFHDLAKLGEIEQLSILDNLGKINKAMTRLKEIPSQFEKVPRVPGLRGHEKFRAGPETPGFLRLNAFDNFAEYVKIASKAIHIGPTVAYLHELLLPKYKLAENAPNTWKFLSNWLEYQKGVEPIMYFENPVARRRIKELSSNIAVSYITYSFQSALNQMSSMNNTFAFLGTFRTAEGLVKAMSPYQYARASKKSNILTVRSPEVALIESGRPHPILPGKAGRTASDIWKKTRQIGSQPLMIVDDFVAHASWLGAEAKAKRIFKTSKTYQELSGEQRSKAMEKFSRDYADDVVERAQGSASRAARAPIQRTAEGAAITTLQTFVIAQFEFISRHLLGIKNPDITKLEQVARVTRYVLGTAAISYAFDLAGMRTPTPTPAKAFLEEEQKSKDYTKAMIAAGKELVEYLPIVGGKLKYGSEVAGVVLNELVTLSKGDATAIPRLLGIPGFNQLLKSYRASERKGTNVDVIFGRYVEKSKKGRAKRQQR